MSTDRDPTTSDELTRLGAYLANFAADTEDPTARAIALQLSVLVDSCEALVSAEPEEEPYAGRYITRATAATTALLNIVIRLAKGQTP